MKKLVYLPCWSDENKVVYQFYKDIPSTWSEFFKNIYAVKISINCLQIFPVIPPEMLSMWNRVNFTVQYLQKECSVSPKKLLYIGTYPFWTDWRILIAVPAGPHHQGIMWSIHCFSYMWSKSPNCFRIKMSISMCTGTFATKRLKCQ